MVPTQSMFIGNRHKSTNREIRVCVEQLHKGLELLAVHQVEQEEVAANHLQALFAALLENRASDQTRREHDNIEN